jgi:uncharacterized RmlC-like cupin family protein
MNLNALCHGLLLPPWQSSRSSAAGPDSTASRASNIFSAVSAESTGARAICMHLLEMPPGASAKPHYHEAHETTIFVLEGAAEMRHGPKLEHVMRVEAGDFI